MKEDFNSALGIMPLMAILRGIRPEEVEDIASVLISSGLRVLEVPLNSPDAFDSLARLVARFGETAVIGAGTVMSREEVQELKRIGVPLVVSPHVDPDVIAATAEAGLVAVPGATTPSECFAALRAGATAIKLFPTEIIGAMGIKAMRVVLPKDLRVIAVGGIDAVSMPVLAAAGCDAFGVGSALYKPGMDTETVRAKADSLVAAVRNSLVRR